MKVRRLHLYTASLYIMLAAYMTAPAISYKIGLPRIDNFLTVGFILFSLVAAVTERRRYPAKAARPMLLVGLMAAWASLHLIITTLSATRFADLMFFLVLPSLMYIMYLVIRYHSDSLGFIRRFLTVFVLFVALPPFVELLTGIQLTTASGEELAIESGAVKGLFFNPNNLATAAVCLAPAVLFFFNISVEKAKDSLHGWILFALLGAAIFLSVSRTAIGCYLVLLAAYLMYRKNGPATVITVSAAAFLFSMLPQQALQEFLLSLNNNEFLERFSSRLYLFLYDFGSDNSVSYRQEIYNYFADNPPLLLTGYGPKNFIGYFGGHLSYDLAFENPHSFLIELYLSFGIVSLFAFAAYVYTYCNTIVLRKRLDNRAKWVSVLAMVIFIIAGFIPSSILRLPFIWLPCFMILLYSVLRPSEKIRPAPFHAATRQIS